MEWVNVIISAIATVIGFVGGGIGVFFWKENKEMQKAAAHKSTTEARLAEADFAEEILAKYEKGILDRMDSGEAVRKKEFQELEQKIDRRFDVIEAEDKKQNEILKDVVEYLNGDFQQFEKEKHKKTKKTKSL